VLDLLFVYGTLRRGFSRHKFLQAADVKYEGRGSVHGKPYDLGNFPGALPSRDDSVQVAGEVYRLPNAEHALKVLDEVEAFGPVSPQTSLFRRELVEVRLENRVTVQAWVYWLNRWHGPRRRIASGHYGANSEGNREL
jgi:pyruvate carboxylase